jgi:hypothetical protein
VCWFNWRSFTNERKFSFGKSNKSHLLLFNVCINFSVGGFAAQNAKLSYAQNKRDALRSAYFMRNLVKASGSREVIIESQNFGRRSVASKLVNRAEVVVNKKAVRVCDTAVLSTASSNLMVKPSRLQLLVVDALKRSKGISESIIRVDRLQAAAKRRRVNPNGVPLEFIAKPKGVVEEPREVWRRLQKNWRYIVQFSIKETSMDTYSTAWRVYQKFCGIAGIADISLRRVSEEFVATRELEFGINPFSYQVTVLLSFIAFLYGEQQVSHSTVGLYISGVRHWFKQMFLREHDACFEEPILSQARSALQYLAVKDDSLAAEKRTLPFTCDMIVYTGSVYLKRGSQDWKSRAIHVCLVVVFCCLMRSCEIFITAANHYLRGQDVEYGLWIDGIEIKIFPRDAWKYNLSAVRNVTITVHSAKNDWEGEGHRMFFSVNDPECLSYGFDLVLVMFAWSQESRPRNDDSFLMYKGKEMVTYNEVTAVIKDVAIEFGFDPSHFHMHSLRVGAASTLAAAGKPSHYIQKMGRWKSLAFLQYIHWAVSGMAEALNTLSNPAVFTAAHIKRINPAAVLQV